MRTVKLTHAEIATCQVALSHLADLYTNAGADELTIEMRQFVAHVKRTQSVISNPRKNGREVLQ